MPVEPESRPSSQPTSPPPAQGRSASAWAFLRPLPAEAFQRDRAYRIARLLAVVAALFVLWVLWRLTASRPAHHDAAVEAQEPAQAPAGRDPIDTAR